MIRNMHMNASCLEETSSLYLASPSVVTFSRIISFKMLRAPIFLEARAAEVSHLEWEWEWELGGMGKLKLGEICLFRFCSFNPFITHSHTHSPAEKAELPEDRSHGSTKPCATGIYSTSPESFHPFHSAKNWTPRGKNFPEQLGALSSPREARRIFNQG